MNRIATSIRNRLSLRRPQEESLGIMADLADKLILQKNADLTAELEKVTSFCPTCTDFERNFPSLCFALATEVGKTRLMGAFIAYLFLAKNIRNFFVLAPNLTVYNKLIEDFSNTSSPKYVFQGIGEFVHRRPRIITGDNYEEVRQGELFKYEVHINIFNIGKINAETRGGKSPRIKRLAECLGYSYFDYLTNLDDLVVLMDESHHYRADRGMEVINELNPILGLELTATPQVERSGGTIKFKNVVYEYSLARAMRDGFVKEPAVATRRDFDPTHYSQEDLDRIKLEDGIRIHEDTKVALDIYARDTKTNPVKPFVLVVSQSTEHAGKLKQMIVSQGFFDGYYADKVMEIHSNQTGGEKDENIERLVNLENPLNKIEIVIHVNMLKEGWDVTNLYTIIPLRTATSMTLREQTIGRGLRLPYGKRTGNDKVDKLTIIAHDKFQEIVDEANKPDSIIRKENIITIDAEELGRPKEVITVVSNIEQRLEEERRQIEAIQEPEEKQKAQVNFEVKQAILSALPDLNTEVTNISELKKEEIKAIAVERIKQSIQYAPQPYLFADDMVREVEAAYETVVDEFATNVIEIPRIMILQRGEVKSGFHVFDLDAKSLNYQPVSEEILVKKLREQENGIDIVIGKGRIILDTPENIIVNELINFPEIDYDEQAEFLFKLASDAVAKFRTYLADDKVMNVVQFHKKEIGRYIYSQMMEHFYCDTPAFEEPVVKPFSRIEEHNLAKYTKDSIHHYTETIVPTNTISGKVFSGFKKSCHKFYKFDSKTEKDFAIILEQDSAVMKWLRPAQKQFKIYWKHNSRQYHPDFVAETRDTIYMIETKKEGDIETADVQEKTKAALLYCKNATDFTTRNGGKPWKYVLISHNAVMTNMSFETMVKKFALS
ncbi:MAG: DEAD/DEAH box helicase family protein [Pseudomonadota bacterium]|nr:DEAD/DEAH box helicase family protein [Pseudomonadota bacterium]